MRSLERRLRDLEARRAVDEDIVIEIAYVNEPPKGFESPKTVETGTGHGKQVTTVYLNEGGLNL
jgi:hypothetical protein